MVTSLRMCKIFIDVSVQSWLLAYKTAPKNIRDDSRTQKTWRTKSYMQTTATQNSITRVAKRRRKMRAVLLIFLPKKMIICVLVPCSIISFSRSKSAFASFWAFARIDHLRSHIDLVDSPPSYPSVHSILMASVWLIGSSCLCVGACSKSPSSSQFLYSFFWGDYFSSETFSSFTTVSPRSLAVGLLAKFWLKPHIK